MKTINKGFTLIEVMIAVAIIAILVAIAYPSYADYMQRKTLATALPALTNTKTLVDQYFLSHRDSAAATVAAAVGGPCAPTIPGPTQGAFLVSCSPVAVTLDGVSTGTFTYTINAVGQPGTRANGFVYSIDQSGQRSMTATGAYAAGWSGSAKCWLFKKGDVC